MTLNAEHLENEFREWLRQIPTAEKKQEAEKVIFALFSTEPDDRYQWTEQDNCEQVRKILRRHLRFLFAGLCPAPRGLTLCDFPQRVVAYAENKKRATRAASLSALKSPQSALRSLLSVALSSAVVKSIFMIPLFYLFCQYFGWHYLP